MAFRKNFATVERRLKRKKKIPRSRPQVIKHVPGSKVAGDMDVKKLIEKFFLELTQATKHSATVKQPMYHLLGLLAEVFPEESVNYAERLVDTYVRTMKMEVRI